jgi:hypothetical protein
LLFLSLALQLYGLDRVDEGELWLQESKENTYQCLAVYQLGGTKVITLRFMMMRAGRLSECRDVCYQTLMGALPRQPLYFRARARECQEIPQSLIVV